MPEKLVLSATKNTINILEDKWLYASNSITFARNAHTRSISNSQNALIVRNYLTSKKIQPRRRSPISKSFTSYSLHLEIMLLLIGGVTHADKCFPSNVCLSTTVQSRVAVSAKTKCRVDAVKIASSGKKSNPKEIG